MGWNTFLIPYAKPVNSAYSLISSRVLFIYYYLKKKDLISNAVVALHHQLECKDFIISRFNTLLRRITAGELVDTVKRLVQEGNVRRLIIKKPSGEPLLEIPLTAGVIVGGALAVIAPVLAALGALAALLAKVKVVIIRAEDDDKNDTQL